MTWKVCHLRLPVQLRGNLWHGFNFWIRCMRYFAVAIGQASGTDGMAGPFDRTAARRAGLRLCLFICGECPANPNILFALLGGACSTLDADD